MYHTKYKIDICVDRKWINFRLIHALKLTKNGRNTLPE